MKKFIQQKAAFTLAEVFSPHSKGQRRVAFTLAEVLITLGIIGVVAAITMPTLIQNYKKTVYVNQLKKSVSTLEQGFQKMLADEGVDKLSDTEIFTKIVDIDCTPYSYTNDANCKQFYDDLKKYFKFDIKKTKSDYYIWSLAGNGEADNDLADSDILMFVDGMWMDLSVYMTMNESYFRIDVNGGKKPNMYGKDVFTFNLLDNGRLSPSGNAEDCIRVNSYGDSCAAYIIENGWKMDY